MSWLARLWLRSTRTRRRRSSQALRAIEKAEWARAFALARAGTDPAFRLRPGHAMLLSVALAQAPAEVAQAILGSSPIPKASAGEPHPLWVAWRSAVGSREKFGLLIRAGSDPEAPAGAWGTRLLHAAACSGDDDLVRELLRAGARAERRDREGRLAVQYARMAGRADIVQALLAAGSPDEGVELADTERALISTSGYLSQVHETVKSGFRFAEIPIRSLVARLAIDAEASTTLTYAFGVARELRVRLDERDRLSVEIFALGDGEPRRLADALAGLGRASLSLRDLLGRLIDCLRKLDGAAAAASGPAESASIEGLSRARSEAETARIFRALAKRLHPDALSGRPDQERLESERKMAELNLAYERKRRDLKSR